MWIYVVTTTMERTLYYLSPKIDAGIVREKVKLLPGEYIYGMTCLGKVEE